MALQSEADRLARAEGISGINTTGTQKYRLMRHMCIVTKKGSEVQYSDYVIEGTVEEVDAIIQKWAADIRREVLLTRQLSCVAELSLTD